VVLVLLVVVVMLVVVVVVVIICSWGAGSCHCLLRNMYYYVTSIEVYNDVLSTHEDCFCFGMIGL
jgi:hypothetical protein